MFNVIRADRAWNVYKFPPELIAWRDKVIAVDPGSRPSLIEMTRKNRLFHGKMLSGAWDRTDDFVDFAAENEVQALVSCKLRLLCIRNSSPGFEPGRGYSFDAYSQYVEWPYIGSTHGVAQTTTDHRIAGWDLLDLSYSGSGIGAETTLGTNLMNFRSRSGINMSAAINTPALVPFALPSPARGDGFAAFSTSEASVMRGHKDGVRLADATGLTIAAGLLDRPFYIGGRNVQGNLRGTRVCTVMCAEIGGQMTDAQELACYQGWREIAISRHLAELED